VSFRNGSIIATYMLPKAVFQTVAHHNGVVGVAGSNPVAPT